MVSKTVLRSHLVAMDAFGLLKLRSSVVLGISEVVYSLFLGVLVGVMLLELIHLASMLGL
jgi:hypothetical protein